MVSISCSGKLHAFALAEQMERLHLLDDLYSTYAYQKNTIWRKFVKRIDREQVPPAKIHTNIPLAFPAKLWQSKAHVWNDLFDKWVAGRLKNSRSRVFIGWSGMSLNAIRAAKKKGMVTILERGSSHIQYQDKILTEEFQRFGQSFSINPAVIKKELQEYQEADYISIPSLFVKNSFLEYGLPAAKLVVNPYGAGHSFQSSPGQGDKKEKFIILYLGTLSVQKGLIYLFRAIEMLGFPESAYEVWFIGHLQEEMQETVQQYRRPNWKFFGQVNYYDLPQYLGQCDIGVQPSLQEGLSMVIPQMMACGIPVIATTNTGGESIIENGVDGFVVPIRDPAAIAGKMTCLYNDREKLSAMKTAAAAAIKKGYTWDDYGNRYAAFLQKAMHS